MNEIDLNNVAEEIFNHACINRQDNKTKELNKITSGFNDLHECAKYHYKIIAEWHLKKMSEKTFNNK